MVRGLLMLSLRPRLILTTDTDWDSDTDSDTPLLDMAMDSDTAMDSSTARGLLMLRPIPTTPPTDSDTPDTMVLVTLGTMVSDSDTTAMDSDTPTARGLLMLSLRLRLILTTDTALDTPDTSDTPDTADTTTASRLYQDLSLNQQLEFRQKWIVISLKFPSPVLQFQCYHNKSLVMVCRKQENQINRN